MDNYPLPPETGDFKRDAEAIEAWNKKHPLGPKQAFHFVLTPEMRDWSQAQIEEYARARYAPTPRHTFEQVRVFEDMTVTPLRFVAVVQVRIKKK